MKLLKNLRFVFLLLCLLSSFYFLGSSLFARNFGVVIIDVAKDGKCNFKSGDVITSVSGVEVKNIEDFKIGEKNIKSGEYVAMVVNGGPGGCIAARDSYLGLDVVELPSNKFKLGMNIGGGSEISIGLKNENLEKVIKIVDDRIKFLGLPETSASVSDSLIKIRTIEVEKIKSIIANGNFEGKVWREIKGENEIKIGNANYPFEVVDEKIKINNSIYGEGQSFLLEDIRFDLINVTNNSITIETVTFTNEDILNVLSSYGYVSYNSGIRAYEFNIPLEISNQSLERFGKILKGLKTSFIGNQPALDGYLVYYMDGKRINSLNIPIPYEWVGKEIKNMPVIGFEKSQQEALDEKIKIQAILESGKLPDLEIVGIKHFEGDIKGVIEWVTLLPLSAIIISILLLSFVRYKNIKLGLYASLLILAEAVCIVGIIAITQRVFAHGWILDVFSIIGLIVLMGSGIEFLIYSKDRKIMRFLKFFEIGLVVFSLLTLFTSWRGLGLAIIVGIFMRNLITKGLYSELEKTT